MPTHAALGPIITERSRGCVASASSSVSVAPGKNPLISW